MSTNKKEIYWNLDWFLLTDKKKFFTSCLADYIFCHVDIIYSLQVDSKILFQKITPFFGTPCVISPDTTWYIASWHACILLAAIKSCRSTSLLHTQKQNSLVQ